MITVRPALPAEYERVGALTLSAYRALPVDHLWGGYDREILDTAGRSEHGDIFVAVDEHGRVVGAVTYVAHADSAWSEWTEPGEAQFRLLAVDPDRRGHGAGSALVQVCVDRATAAGQPVVIHTTAWMVGAQRIYERFGFVRRPDRDVAYETWNAARIPDLPAEWVGRPFLAFARSDPAAG